MLVLFPSCLADNIDQGSRRSTGSFSPSLRLIDVAQGALRPARPFASSLTTSLSGFPVRTD
jgi:hypothetical protein